MLKKDKKGSKKRSPACDEHGYVINANGADLIFFLPINKLSVRKRSLETA